MKLKILHFCLFFLFFQAFCFSQDKIIFTSGKERKCFILNEDSSIVKVILFKDGKNFNTSINREYIQSIIYDANIRQKDNITFLNGSTIACRFIRENSDSVFTISFVNGLNKTTLFDKNSIKTIEKQNDSITNSELKYSSDTKISVSTGFCIPLGEYAESLGINSGYATLGGKISIQLSIGLTKYLNLGLKGYGLYNGTENYLNNTSWKSGGLLGGLELIIPNTPFDLEFRALGGLMYLMSPDFKYNPRNSGLIEYNKTSTNALGVDLGIGFNINSKSNFNFLAKVDYLYANFEFDEPKATTTYTFQTSSIEYDNIGNIQIPRIVYTNTKKIIESNNQILSALSISIGFGYKF